MYSFDASGSIEDLGDPLLYIPQVSWISCNFHIYSTLLSNALTLLINVKFCVQEKFVIRRVSFCVGFVICEYINFPYNVSHLRELLMGFQNWIDIKKILI